MFNGDANLMGLQVFKLVHGPFWKQTCSRMFGVIRNSWCQKLKLLCRLRKWNWRRVRNTMEPSHCSSLSCSSLAAYLIRHPVRTMHWNHWRRGRQCLTTIRKKIFIRRPYRYLQGQVYTDLNFEWRWYNAGSSPTYKCSSTARASPQAAKMNGNLWKRCMIPHLHPKRKCSFSGH